MSSVTRQVSMIIVCCLLFGSIAAGEWAQWHGPERNAKSAETGLLKKWPADGPKMLWSSDGLGIGWSTVSISMGTIYTTGMEKRSKEGFLFAFDMAGDLKWKQSYGPDWGGSFAGARCTPTIEDGLVYVISGVGRVGCFDAESGKKLWLVNPFEEFGGKYGHWGISESPLIVDGKVIFTVGGEKAAMVALDKMTGKVVWSSKSVGDVSSYCSPILVERRGRKVIVNMLGKSVICVDAADGKILWQDEFEDYLETTKAINPVTPIQHDGSVYVTSGYDCGGTLLELSADGSSFERKWVDTVMDNHHGGVIYLDGYIYGSSWRGNGDGNWVCLDWKSGEVKWEEHWHNKGSIFFADGMLYCYEEKDGNLALVRPTPEKFEIVSSFEVKPGDGKHWGHPVVYGGVLYVRHGDVLIAYDIKAKK